MNKFARVKELTCEGCGAKFFGKFGKYCDVCRKKRRQNKRHIEIKVCPVCNKERRMYAEQVVCRMCSAEQEKKSKTERLTIQQAEERIRARRVGGKLLKTPICPNFDGGKVICATCEPGAWKFKDCGVKKE